MTHEENIAIYWLRCEIMGLSEQSQNTDILWEKGHVLHVSQLNEKDPSMGKNYKLASLYKSLSLISLNMETKLQKYKYTNWRTYLSNQSAGSLQ